MSRQQIDKLLKVAIVATFIMLVCEIIFAIPTVINFFSDWIKSSSGIYIYAIIWFIMFAQCTVLNIPAYVVLSASVSIGIKTLSWEFLLTVITAYMAGCILAYWLGRIFGTKATKWCAGSEEEFEKWSNYLNTKGKWWYFLTVMLPLFPDDLLCIVAGSVKFNFGFYTLVNLIGRSVGLVTMVVTLELIGKIGGGNFPFMILVWAVALVLELCVYFINKKKMRQNTI